MSWKDCNVRVYDKFRFILVHIIKSSSKEGRSCAFMMFWLTQKWNLVLTLTFSILTSFSLFHFPYEKRRPPCSLCSADPADSGGTVSTLCLSWQRSRSVSCCSTASFISGDEEEDPYEEFIHTGQQSSQATWQRRFTLKRRAVWGKEGEHMGDVLTVAKPKKLKPLQNLQ